MPEGQVAGVTKTGSEGLSQEWSWPVDRAWVLSSPAVDSLHVGQPSGQN